MDSWAEKAGLCATAVLLIAMRKDTTAINEGIRDRMIPGALMYFMGGILTGRHRRCQMVAAMPGVAARDPRLNDGHRVETGPGRMVVEPGSICGSQVVIREVDLLYTYSGRAEEATKVAWRLLEGASIGVIVPGGGECGSSLDPGRDRAPVRRLVPGRMLNAEVVHVVVVVDCPEVARC